MTDPTLLIDARTSTPTASCPDCHTPSARVHGGHPEVRGAMSHAHQSATVAAVPGPPPDHGVGGVCQATRRWSWPGLEVSRALYASRGDRESSLAGAGGRAGDLSVERLCPWEPPTPDDPRCHRVRPAVPAPYLALGLPASPSLWCARASCPPGEARSVPGIPPAADERSTFGASCHQGGSSTGGCWGSMSSLPAWADGLGANPAPPARALRQVDAAAGLGYLIIGRRDAQTVCFSP